MKWNRIETDVEINEIIFYNDECAVYSIKYYQTDYQSWWGNCAWINGWDAETEEFTACVEFL